MKKQLKFWESDWGTNLKKSGLMDGANKFFENKNVEYVDMKINSIYNDEGELYQTIVIAYYEIDGSN